MTTEKDIQLITELKIRDRLNLKKIKRLLSEGASVSAVDDEKIPAIHLAIQKTRHHTDENIIALLELLLAHGADLKSENDTGDHLICAAIEAESLTIMQWCIDKGAGPSDHSQVGCGWGAIHYAVHFGNIEAVKILISQGWDINDQATFSKDTPLSIAISKGHDLEEVKELIGLGADPNMKVFDKYENDAFCDLKSISELARLLVDTKIANYLKEVKMAQKELEELDDISKRSSHQASLNIAPKESNRL